MRISLPSQHPLKKKIHISWHIAVVSLGVLIGVAVAGFSTTAFTGYEWLVIGGLLTIPAIISRTRYLLILMLAAGLLLGLWRGSGEQQALSAYQPFIRKNVTVSGMVAEDTSFGSRGDLRFRLRHVTVDDNELGGTIWISTAKDLDIKRGDIVYATGTLEKGFGTIAAAMYRANVTEIQRPVPGDVGRRTRDWFGQGVSNSMPDFQAGLALAFLVGQKLTVSDTLNDQLRTVGLIHAVVASGYHLTVLVGVVRRLLVRISKYLTFIFSAGMITGFILVTGFSPSMTRAGLVSGLGLLAWYYGRTIHPLVLLPFAAAITVLIQPEYIWGDVGWYLSFAAFTGVLLLAPLLHDYLWGKTKRPGIFREIIIATIAAQLLTLPITVAVFGYYSAYALVANILVVPLIPFTMLLTFIAGCVGLLFPAIAPLFGMPIVWILGYMTWIVDWIAQLPGAKTEVHLEAAGVVIAYIAIAIFIICLWMKTKHNFRNDNDQKLL